ncbi:MAG: BtpA/SgcQ family protein [Halobacteriaceae archaeon]
MDCEAIFGTSRPVIGMVHLPPLPGAPRFDGDRERIHEVARRDAAALAEGGVDAVMLENFGDAPFYPDDVPKHVVAELTAVAETVRAAADGLPLGVNVLRNDGAAALAVAAATGGDFIRVNVHTGARVADQGILQGQAHETMRLRDRLAADVAVLADVDVKHSAPLADADYEAESLAENAERGLADGLVVSGARTGRPTALEDLRAAVERRDAIGVETPVFVGSGVTKDRVGELLDVADGAIVGTALKADGETENPIDPDRVAALMAAAH